MGGFVHFYDFALAGKRTDGILGARGRHAGFDFVAGTCEGGGGGGGGGVGGLVALEALQALRAEHVSAQEHARAAGIGIKFGFTADARHWGLNSAQ